MDRTLPYKKGARQGIFASPFYFSNYVLEKCSHYKLHGHGQIRTWSNSVD